VLCGAILSILLFSASMLYFSSAYRPMSPELNLLRYGGIGLGIVLLVSGATAVWSKTVHRLPKSLLCTWAVFSLACAISSASTSELTSDAVELFWLLFCVPICVFLCGSVLVRHSGFTTLMWAVAISHGAIIAVSLIYDPALKFRYVGLLGDPNQLGVLSLMIGLLILFYIPPAISRLPRGLWRFGVLTTALIGVVVLIATSSHRTSLITLCGCLLIGLGRFRRIRGRVIVVLLPTVALMLMAALSWEDTGHMLDQLLNKNSSAMNKGKLLSGREEIWRFALEDITAFGHGRQYFVTSTNGLGAHNSFLHVLGTRGLVPAAVLVLLFLQSLYYVSKLCRDRTLDYACAQGPLLVTSAYWMLSMTEGMFSSLGNGVHVGFLITLGYSASMVASGRERATAESLARSLFPRGSASKDPR
jgi:hypothetical protein